MNIQNAPLTKELKDRIQKYVIDMGNKLACLETIGMNLRTLDKIMKREWASIEHLGKLENYCDEVEYFPAGRAVQEIVRNTEMK